MRAISENEDLHNASSGEDFRRRFPYEKIKKASKYQFALESADFVKQIYALIFDLAFMGFLAPAYIWNWWQRVFHSWGWCENSG